jgi:hypothetical protein
MGTLGFRELLHLVDTVSGREFAPKPPIIVHCSAGIGRTGTFCAVHSTLRKLLYNLLAHPDVFALDITQLVIDTVLRLRRQRYGMVQTKVRDTHTHTHTHTQTPERRLSLSLSRARSRDCSFDSSVCSVHCKLTKK